MSCPVCDVGVLWPNGWTDQDETWHAGRPRPGHTALDGDTAIPPRKRHSPPQFSSHIRCRKMAGWIKMPLGREIGLGPGHIVLYGDPAPPQKTGTAPAQFSAHVRCGQMAGWIKMPLGARIRPVPGHIVLQYVSASQFSADVYCGQTVAHLSLLLSTCYILGVVILSVCPSVRLFVRLSVCHTRACD